MKSPAPGKDPQVAIKGTHKLGGSWTPGTISLVSGGKGSSRLPRNRFQARNSDSLSSFLFPVALHEAESKGDGSQLSSRTGRKATVALTVPRAKNANCSYGKSGKSSCLKTGLSSSLRRAQKEELHMSPGPSCVGSNPSCSHTHTHQGSCRHLTPGPEEAPTPDRSRGSL